MNETRGRADTLRRRVIGLFFLGLLSMAILAVGIGWACGDWGSIRFGWLNQVLGPALTVGGLALVGWSVRVQYVSAKARPRRKSPRKDW